MRDGTAVTTPDSERNPSLGTRWRALISRRGECTQTTSLLTGDKD